MMDLSAQGESFLHSYEALRLKAYDDGTGVLTIGFGHTSRAGSPTVTPKMVITQAQAAEIFQNDIMQYIDAVNEHVSVPLSQQQFDALVSFTYNVGPDNFKNSTLLRTLNNGDYEGAANEMRRWINAGGKPSLGLYRRRSDEYQIFMHGDYNREYPDFDEGFTAPISEPSSKEQQSQKGKSAIRHSGKEGVITCLAPDVCLTPVGSSVVPIPYMITSKLEWSDKTVNNTSFGGLEAFTMASRTNKVTGDEPGSKGGVKSGVNKGWCRPKSNKTSFFVKGEEVIHHDHIYEMNCNGPDGPSNTLGKIRFVE